MKTNDKKKPSLELSSLTNTTSHADQDHSVQHDSVSWSNQLNLYCGMMQDCMTEAGGLGMKVLGGCLVVSLVIGLAVGLTWIDNKLDNMCTNNKVINDSGSTLYFEGSLGTVYDGWSFHVDIPNNTTDLYPFSWYNDYYQKEDCILKVRPKNSGKADIEVTDCSPTPNAFDTGVCQWTIKDKYDRRLRGLSNDEEQIKTGKKVLSSTEVGFFSPKPKHDYDVLTADSRHAAGMN